MSKYAVSIFGVKQGGSTESQVMRIFVHDTVDKAAAVGAATLSFRKIHPKYDIRFICEIEV